MIPELSYDERESLVWLAELLDPSRFDVVVSVERKATAILRALLDLSPQIEHEWNWSRVLSSDALQYLPPNWLEGKRILVFNEMIHRGHSTKRTIEEIHRNTSVRNKHIETAAFFLHTDFDTHGCWATKKFRSIYKGSKPDHVIQRHVSDDLYAVLRERLIASMRSKGALLLDTEHLESTFTLTIPHRRFLDALHTFGEPVEYEDDDLGHYPGVTIRNPVVADIERLRSALPEKSLIELKEPKKVRLVRRGPKEFVWIPIWYPPIAVDAVSTLDDWAHAPKYLRPALEQCPRRKLPDLSFHLASLITGIELLRSLWSALAPFVHRGIEPITASGSIDAPSALGHLRALYPLVDYDELSIAVRAAISSYTDKEASKRMQKLAALERGQSDARMSPEVIDGRRRRDDCIAVFADLIRTRSRFSIGEDWFDDDDSLSRPFPSFTWREYWQTGERLGIPEPLRSVLMDTAIDNAVLKTTHKRETRDGVRLIVRAFEPDSEYAFEALERIVYGAEEVPVNV